MNKKLSIFLLVTVAMLALYGCGGGGGGGTSAPPSTGGGNNTGGGGTNYIVSGVASKGLLALADVSVYKIVAGAKDALLKSGKTGADGSYSLSIGTYAGPVLVEVSGGTYIDEATGTIIPLASPLHAVTTASGNLTTIAVTPLTELAYQLAGTTLTASNINAKNALVASTFKLNDIIGTQPVAPTAVAFQTATQAQIDYTLALATISELVQTKLATDPAATLSSTITDLKNDLSTSGQLSVSNAVLFQQSLSTYIGSAVNKTGVSSTSGLSLASVGGKQATIRLSTTGSVAAGTTISGVQLVLNVPQGTVKTDLSLQYDIASGSVPVAATAAFASGNGAGSKIAAGYKNGQVTLALMNGGGVAVGEFATVVVDIPYNVTVQPSIFTVDTTTVTVVDKFGVKISGLSAQATTTIQ